MNASKHYALWFGLAAGLSASVSWAGAYIFAGENNGVNVVAHPPNYTGSGGTVSVKVCITPGTANASEMEIPVQNIVNTVNAFEAQQPNLISGGAGNVPFSEYDFESVALHEVGHCIGLAHPNLGGKGGAAAEFTNSTDGANNSFDANDGPDNIDGTADDLRGDDVNLHWFFIGDNNPFVRGNATVDAGTYSRDINDLPGDDNFPINASRQTGPSLGFNDTEAVMQQGTFNGEVQREFAIDDIVTLEFARSGVDETAGTADDYEVQLTYGGISDASDCDVNLEFTTDEEVTSFAVCNVGGSFLSANHVRITSATASFNENAVTWFFNDVPNSVDDSIFNDRFEVL